MKTNTSLVEMLENQIKDINRQVENIANAVAATGLFSEVMQNKLNSLEEAKKKITDTLIQEKSGGRYLSATREEIARVFRKAQDLLLNGEFEDKRAVLHMFLNKVLVYKNFVEIYTNLLPLTLSGGIDLNINTREYLTGVEANISNMSENTTKTDGFDPPALPLNPEIHNRENTDGDPYGNRTRDTAVKGRCLDRLTKGP